LVNIFEERKMSETIIETQNLTVYYGKYRGIQEVNLSVEKGEVFGFLGPNGAGKTTTQRVLLDVIRPTAGRAAIFGLDCREQGVELRRRVGYLPGEMALYKDMRADAFFKMHEYLRGANGAKGYWRDLARRLDLDISRKIGNFSRGNKQKVGIVAAFMSKPDLLILDEPTGGLDPLVQQTVLEMVREVKADGRTIFFSSHILPEVQAVCDRVAIIREGELVATRRVEELIAARLNRMSLMFAELPPAGAFNIEGVTEISRSGQGVVLEVRDGLPQVLAAAAQYNIRDIETHNMSLEEIFLDFYGRGNGGTNG
jgi:ABC-2 type transport system ATP-binding protein